MYPTWTILTKYFLLQPHPNCLSPFSSYSRFPFQLFSPIPSYFPLGYSGIYTTYSNGSLYLCSPGAVKQVSSQIKAPIILFTYYNPIFYHFVYCQGPCIECWCPDSLGANRCPGYVARLDVGWTNLEFYIICWTGNDYPPPLQLFRKFIQFCESRLPS